MILPPPFLRTNSIDSLVLYLYVWHPCCADSAMLPPFILYNSLLSARNIACPLVAADLDIIHLTVHIPRLNIFSHHPRRTRRVARHLDGLNEIIFRFPFGSSVRFYFSWATPYWSPSRLQWNCFSSPFERKNESNHRRKSANVWTYLCFTLLRRPIQISLFLEVYQFQSHLISISRQLLVSSQLSKLANWSY